MKKKILLGALFIFILSNINALEITEDKYLNDGLINFKNTKDNENKVTVTRNDITVQNKGILKIGYEELGVSVQNASDGIRTDVTNGIIAISNNLIIDNTGIISSQIKMTGGNTTKIGDTYFLNSGNGIKTGIDTTINNAGIIKGSVIQISGEVGDSTFASSDALSRGFRIGNGIWGNFIGENAGVIKGDSLIMSGVATSNRRSNVFSYTGTIGNGIAGNFIGKNIGTILGNSVIVGGKAVIINNNGESYANSYVNLDAGANGIYGNSEENYGLISGYAELTGGESHEAKQNLYGSGYINPQKSANGIYGNITENEGNLQGYVEILGENLNLIDGVKTKGHTRIIFSGNGIAFQGDITKNIINKGLINGVQSAMAAQNISGVINNYGVMAGKEIFSDGEEGIKNDSSATVANNKILGILQVAKENNQGTYINLEEDSSDRLRVALDIDGDVIIEDIIVANNLNVASLGGTNNSGKTILNAKENNINVIEKPSDKEYGGTTVTSGKDSYEEIALDTNYDNHIINGAGIKNAVLSVNDGVNVNLNDSIVNGYKTAMSLNNNSVVTASNTIFNGGGLKNEDAVIDIKGNNASATINGTSIINGIATVSGNNSTVSIGNEVMVNGDLTSNKDSNNTLNLGDKTSEELRLFHNIDGFAKINTSGNITAYETAKISTGDIHVKDGKFVVRIDGTERDEEDKVIGHALYDHLGKISVEVPTAGTPSVYIQELPKDAQLVFKASGLGVGTIIAMKGTDISNLYDPQIGTMSVAHTAIKHKDENGLLTGDVEISLKNFDDIFGGHGDLPTPELDSTPKEPSNSDNSNSGNKDDLGEIYDSIVNGDQLPNLAPTTDTENKTEDEARKGLLTLLDQIYANTPYAQSAKLSKENVGLFREQILSTKMPKENEWIAEGHGIYSIDEYGKSRDVKVGNTAVSNNYSNKGITTGLLGTAEYGLPQDTSLGFAVGGSHQKLDMSMNSKLKGEVIYLGVFGKKKIDNYLFTAGLGYQYGNYDGTRTIMNEYQSIRNTGGVKTDSFDIYGEVRYTFEDEKGRKIEPKLRLSKLFINEKSVSEKNGTLAIDLDKKSYSIPEIEIGVDFIEPINVKSGKLEAKFGIGVARTFGKNENYVTGKMKNSTDFKIMGPDFEDTKLRLSVGVDYEHGNGVFYNANIRLNVAKDTKKEINAKVGIGYRF
ncbi:autotransporter (plasmid) [Fusobacterium varium]|nr:autotransporter [Fusobacterium varium]